jgi:hypothetical protein
MDLRFSLVSFVRFCKAILQTETFADRKMGRAKGPDISASKSFCLISLPPLSLVFFAG